VKELLERRGKKKKVPDIAATIAAVYGCKWSLKILRAIQNGICRPGAMEKALPGLTTRVQSYYLKRMKALGIIEKTSFPEIPPRVEYRVTPYGIRILSVFASIQALQEQMEAEVNSEDT